MGHKKGLLPGPRRSRLGRGEVVSAEAAHRMGRSRGQKAETGQAVSCCVRDTRSLGRWGGPADEKAWGLFPPYSSVSISPYKCLPSLGIVANI